MFCFCFVTTAKGIVSSRGWGVSLVLHPSTAEDSVSQFVRLTLTLTLDQQVYPPTDMRKCQPRSADNNE